MTIEKTDRWATNVSTQTEPSAGAKQTGFVAGEQPIEKEMNWLLGESRDKLNEVIEDGPNGFPGTVGNEPILTRYIAAGGDAAWAFPEDDSNKVTLGTDGIVGLEVWIDTTADPGSQRKILALEGSTDCKIYVIDAATATEESDSGDLSTTELPAGDWYPLNMCSDGTSVYVLFEDDSAAPTYSQYVQAYDIATWTKKTNWPATGRALTTLTGAAADLAAASNQIAVVSATQIAVACSWNAWASDATEMIALLDMDDGSIDDEGAGDCSGGFGDVALHVCGDGTNIYFATLNEICSCSLADLTAGSGASNLPYEIDTNVAFGILCTGNNFWVSCSGDDEDKPGLFCGNSSIGVTGYSLARLNVDEDGFSQLACVGALAFDGIKFWGRGVIDEYTAGGENRCAVVRFDPSAMVGYVSPDTVIKAPQISASVSTVQKLAPALDSAFTSTAYKHCCAPLVFDGRDIWAAGNRDSGFTGLSGIVFRIPRALLR